MSELIRMKLSVMVTLVLQLVALVYFMAQMQAKIDRTHEIVTEVRRLATITREEQLRRTANVQKIERLERLIEKLRED